MVCRLSAGGRRIRTCGPTSNGIAVEGAPGNGRRLDLTFKGFGYHACIRIGRPTELSQERGPAIRIRFPPATSQRRTVFRLRPPTPRPSSIQAKPNRGTEMNHSPYLDRPLGFVYLPETAPWLAA